MGRRQARAVAALIALLLLASLGGPATAATAEQSASTSAAAVPLGTYGCLGYSGVDRLNPVEEVMQDRLKVSGFAPYRVGTAGNVNWRLDPYRHDTWTLWLHSLRWIGSLINSYKRTGNAVHLERATVIARDWIADNPMGSLTGQASEATAHRTNVLLCLWDVMGDRPWLRSAITAHGARLMTHYSGAWNHGLDENIALMGAGCVLGRRDFADRAVQRTKEMAPLVVDAQGVTNEQSVGYHVYNHRRFGVLERQFRACGYATPSVLTTRRALMPAFAAHASTPDRFMLPLGDTNLERLEGVAGTPMEYVATGGASGPKPSSTRAIYNAGYAFGRSSWSPLATASHHSLRFGPGRAFHGHHDHMSVTWYARGRNILVDSGHFGYTSSPMRAYARSPEAHNVLLVGGATLSGKAATTLTRHGSGSSWSFYEVRDSAFGGITRTRSVLFASGPDLAVVYDRADSSASRAFTQVWHLNHDMDVQAVTDRGIRAQARTGNTAVHILQIPFPGQRIPAGSTKVIKGRDTPSPQGWVAVQRDGASTRVAAPVVTMTRTTTRTRHLTLIVPTRIGGPVRPTLRQTADGWYHLRVDLGGGVVRTVRISPGGYMGM